MGSFKRKSFLQAVVFTKVTFVILLLVAAYLAFSVYERYTVERSMADRLADTQTEYADLENRRDSLLERVEYLQGDSGIESEIRRNFDVAREGEQVVIIVDEEDEAAPQFVPGSDPEVADDPWWKFW